MDGLFALARLAAMAAGMTIPAALRRLVAKRERDLLGDPDLDELVAMAVMDMLQTAIDTTGLDVEQILDAGAGRGHDRRHLPFPPRSDRDITQTHGAGHTTAWCRRDIERLDTRQAIRARPAQAYTPPSFP
jgi:hypothetical protein